MRIENIIKNSINFTSINLDKKEQEKSDLLLADLRNAKNTDKIKTDLFELYKKHIQKEVSEKTNGIYFEETLQNMYLKFFEAFENVKVPTTKKLIDILNSITPANVKNTRTSIYKNSQLNKNRIEEYNRLLNLAENTELSRTEIELLEKKSKGLTYNDLAAKKNKNINLIRGTVQNAIAKIQDNNGELPKKFDNFAEKLISKYKLNIKKQEVKNILLNNTNLTLYSPKKLFENLDKTSKLLKIEPEDFIKSALKQPTLFCLKPETIIQNINQTAELIKISPEEYIQSILNQPQLFYQRPKTIFENINKTAEALNLSPKVFTEIALKYPQLFCRNSKTIIENVNKTCEQLSVTQKEYIQATLNKPQLLCQKAETIIENINKTSELLDITPKEYTQAAFKKPQLFCQRPQTIAENINNTAELLDIKAKEYIKAALKQPQLFYQKPETIVGNINNGATRLNIQSKEYVQAALKNNSLFYQKPETISENIKKTATLLGIPQNEFTEAALKRPPLFSLKPENIVKKVKIIQFYKEIQNKKTDKIVISMRSDKSLYEIILTYLVKKTDKVNAAMNKNEFVKYLKSSNSIYNFELPRNELAKEFIDFAKEFSDTNLNKQIFKFKIK